MPKRKLAHSMGEIRALDLPGMSLIGIQGEKGNKIAFIEYGSVFAEGNAEELTKRWNSWEAGGALDNLIKSSRALLDNHELTIEVLLSMLFALRAKVKDDSAALDNHKSLIIEAVSSMLEESRSNAKHTPKSGTDEDPSDAQVQADFARERLEER